MARTDPCCLSKTRRSQCSSKKEVFGTLDVIMALKEVKTTFSLLRLNKVVRFRWVMMMNSECSDFYFTTLSTYYFWKMLSKFNSNLENLHYPVKVFMNIISKWMRVIKLRESMSGDTFISVRSPYGLPRGNLGYI